MTTSVHRRQSTETKRLRELLTNLPSHSLYAQNWIPSSTNWLPFFWAGYSQTTRYTYRLPLGQGEEDLWRGISDSARGAVKKGRNRYGLTTRSSTNVERFLGLNRQIFLRQSMQRPFTADLVRRIHAAAAQRGAVTILEAVDGEGAVHAGAMLVRDETTCYYLLGGSDNALRQSGGMNVVMWAAIRDSLARGLKIFDFEGSMIEPIESFFRAFGAARTPYFRVWGPANKPLARLMALRMSAKNRPQRRAT